jgi:ABC-type spermidine/putrescine transport system permease subunit II
VLALGLYPVMLQLGLLRTYAAAIIGHTVVALPLVFVAVSASLNGYAPTFELAAMSLGANWWNTFRHVTLPMIRPGLYAGAILAFATSFDELMLSLFLTGATTRTLPRLIWEHMNDFLTPAIAAVAVLVLLFTLLLFLLASLARPDRPETGRA